VVIGEDRWDVPVVEVAQSVNHLAGRWLDGPDLHLGSVLAKISSHAHQRARGAETGDEVGDSGTSARSRVRCAVVRLGLGVGVLVEERPVGIVGAERLGETHGAVRSSAPGESMISAPQASNNWRRSGDTFDGSTTLRW